MLLLGEIDVITEFLISFYQIDGKIDKKIEKITPQFSILDYVSAEKLHSIQLMPLVNFDKSKNYTHFFAKDHQSGETLKSSISPDDGCVRLRFDIMMAVETNEIVAKFVNIPGTLALKTSDGATLYVNKEIMAEKSNILALSNDNMPILFGQDARYESASVDYLRAVVMELLNFMYTGMVDATSFYANKEAILDASESLGIAGMRELFGGTIVKLLNDDNVDVLKIAAAAVEKDDNELFEKCCRQIGV